jgi:hypothetical protein
VHALCEFGGKVRVITSLPTEVVIRGHALRDILWPFLERDPVFDITGDSRIHGMKVNPGEVVLSADLSRATDVVGPGLALSFFRHLHVLRPAEFDSKWLKLAEDTVGAYFVEYPDGKHIVSSSGWLMGHPSTWAVLCLVHAAIARMSGFDERIRIRGDDLLAIGPQHCVDEYFDLMEHFFLINKEKSFVSPHGGVFAEETFVVRQGSLCKVPHGAPPRGWLNGDFKSLNNCYKVWDELSPKMRRAYRYAILSSGAKQVKALTKHRIPLFLPRVLGGVGIPHSRGIPGAVCGNIYVTKMVTGAGTVASAWKTRLAYRRREEFLNEAKSITYLLHSMGSLGSCTPMTEETLSGLILRADIAMGATWPEGWEDTYGKSQLGEMREPTVSSISRDWERFRRKCRGIKPPLHLLGTNWDEQRLSESILRRQLEGVYWPYRPDPALHL